MEGPKESFEDVPLITALLTYFGFYVLMLMGTINKMLFTPKVAREQNREVSAAVYRIAAEIL